MNQPEQEIKDIFGDAMGAQTSKELAKPQLPEGYSVPQGDRHYWKERAKIAEEKLGYPQEDHFTAKLLTATRKMREQKGERVLSEKAKKLMDSLSWMVESDREDFEKVAIEILGDEIWYEDKPVSWEPVRDSVVYLETFKEFVWVIDVEYDGLFSCITLNRTCYLEQSLRSRPAADTEVLEFVKAFLS